jgi:hypothetical protein
MADTPQEIPLGDLEIAQHIASSARSGRPIDRTPTLEQLLAAFGEPAPTPAARERVAAALRVAGVATAPDVRLAEVGSRVKLDPGGASPGRARRALAGILALAVLLGGAALAAVVLGGGDPDTAADLPATSTTTTSTATTQTTPTATASTPTGTTGTTTVGTVTTATTTKKKPATKKRRKKKRRTPTTVRVTLAPSRPTYLCVKDGTGRALFSGTLSAPRVFRAKVVRINVGLGPSTVLRVNGKRIPMGGSPAGYELRTGGRITPLGTGQRPEC